MFDCYRSPKLYSFSVVMAALIFTFIVMKVTQAVPLTFNMLLLIAAELSVVFGAVEMGMAYSGKYENKDSVFMAMSRAVSAFGLAMFCMLLIAAHEIIKC